MYAEAKSGEIASGQWRTSALAMTKPIRRVDMPPLKGLENGRGKWIATNIPLLTERV